MIIPIILAVLGLIGATIGGMTSLAQTAQNAQSVRETNETNYKIAQETNQANVEQANLAYQRSLPINQVRNLMSAGMSKQGALSQLTGGGSYSAPVMQSAQMQAPQIDLSGLSSSFERLGNIPMNVMQSSLIEDQRNALRVDTMNKIANEQRQQELHEFNMWRQQYDKNSATMLDAASQKIVQKLLDSGKTIEDFKDYESMLRSLGLDNDKDIRNLNHVAQQQLQTSVRDRFSAEYARQQQANANRESQDKHTLALDTLKNSEFGRTLTSKQIDKIEKETELAQTNIDDYYNSHDARTKEYAARAARADFERIMSEFGIAEHDFKNAQWWKRDKDGNIVPSGLALQKQGIADAWKFAGTFFGADMLQDILRGLVTIVK